ncbi:cytochrome P450 [Peristeroidobacter soli]|uniref:cytochrome P450 n=1 Tax=Peristeroidobacter soli TaxID=2497877 RepID=UPI001C377352|nr:cytochrome P450 [Peristeroidobacter soli]
MSRMPDHVFLEDWDPKDPSVLQDQISAYDNMRRRCPVAHSEAMHWSLFRHADVVRALRDPRTYSNEVSTHLSVPNGIDPPLHSDYRDIVDPYFSQQRIDTFEPACREIAEGLIGKLPIDRAVEVMSELAQPFALQAQSAFLDWPAHLHEPLRQWTIRNREATLAQDAVATAAVAQEFDGYIRDLLETRRQATEPADDVTSRLLRERIRGRLLTDEEIVSILRNWTVGELTTIAACVGILVQYLAEHPNVQQQLRQMPTALPTAIDEILRIHPPLLTSRRKTTRSVTIGGKFLAAGSRVTLMWASANRDERAFDAPDEFQLDRNPDENLLYGLGIHVCPGAPLARLELRVIMEELLAYTEWFSPQTHQPPVRAMYPASGYFETWVALG